MPVLFERFADPIRDPIEEAMNDCPTWTAEERWNHIGDTIYNSTINIFGKRERRNPDWFEKGIAKLEPTITGNQK